MRESRGHTNPHGARESDGAIPGRKRWGAAPARRNGPLLGRGGARAHGPIPERW